MTRRNQFFHRTLALLNLAMCLMFLLALSAPALAAKKSQKRTPPKETPLRETPQRRSASIPVEMNYADLVEAVLPSIVRVNTDLGAGSGFFVSSRGEVLTNYHVIQGAQEIVVTPNQGTSAYAMVKDIDAERDMALLVIPRSGTTPYLKISAALPRQGEAIMAVGNPQGLEGTVSNGIVSAFREDNTWVQFTAPISQGSSGGALVNAQGEVVGMPTLLFREGQNLNFAIAPTILRQFYETARKKKPAQAHNLWALRMEEERRNARAKDREQQAFLVFVSELMSQPDFPEFDLWVTERLVQAGMHPDQLGEYIQQTGDYAGATRTLRDWYRSFQSTKRRQRRR